MKKYPIVLGWLVAGFMAIGIMLWAFPRAYPFFPREWKISKVEAEMISLERLRDLAALPEDPYVVTRIDEAAALEHRLQSASGEVDPQTLLESRLMAGLLTWETTVWKPGSRAQDWSHHARVTPGGEVTELLIRVPPEQTAEPISPDRARAEAAVFLLEQGFNLDDFAEPEVRIRESQVRTDLFLRYRYRESVLGEAFPYGVEVVFAGDRLAGFSRYFDDPELPGIRASFQPIQLIVQAKVFLPLLILPLMAIPFVRRYHAGEIGVRRGVQISVVVFLCGLVSMLFSASDASAGVSLGVLSRSQATLVTALQMIILLFFPMGLLSFLSWSVGESLTRARHGTRLAAFDALFKGSWQNATFARASLRGTAAGLVIAAVVWLVLVGLRAQGVWAYGWLLLGPWWESSTWFALPLLTFFLAFSLYTGLFGQLFLISYWEQFVGRLGAVAVAAITAVMLFFGHAYVYPFSWNLLVWAIPPVAYILLYLRYGIYTAVLASFWSSVIMGVVPFFGSSSPSIQLQVALALAGAALPLILSCRSLASDEEFVYRYEDVPPHVRRIAERERQRVELETARGIQASILPNLPGELNGVRICHRYLPATEVGGDFYDVLALTDGRLAVAVGDVAGHGVSSGLVMSMAKSALSVQVDFEPDVQAVFQTLNRMVHQSARKRMLATLCYALLDPIRRELDFASAGHLFPYRLSAAGEVQSLESVSYPLGVREHLEVRVRQTVLESRDILFLFSDGVVEAHAENSDELFGFDRLERVLAESARRGVEGVCDGVLDALENHTDGAPLEDDLTLLALQLP